MTQDQLLTEQLKRLVDGINADIEILNMRVDRLEETIKDHEARLRAVTDAATQFKLLAGLATGGGLLSLINLIKALIQ
jgi:hypothetical protein